MSAQTAIILFLLCLSAFIVIAVFIKSGHFFKCLFLSAVSGAGALFAVNILGKITSVTIGINPLTLMISVLGGIPSVIGLLISRFIFLS